MSYYLLITTSSVGLHLLSLDGTQETFVVQPVLVN